VDKKASVLAITLEEAGSMGNLTWLLTLRVKLLNRLVVGYATLTHF
jgi:hypothetical protein